MCKSGNLFCALVASCLLLAAATPARAAEKSVVIGMSSDANFLDPYQHHETVTNMLTRHFYEPLVSLDAAGTKLIPRLAVSWEVAPDQLTWTFRLRQGVVFSDGGDFSAEDVAWSIERARTTQHRDLVINIKETKVVDPHTVQVVTNTPDGVLLHNLVQLLILPKAYFTRVGDAAANLKPMGTGPYLCDAWVKEDHLNMSANPRYWGAQPAVAKARFRPISNAATRTAALLTGEVDLAMDIPVRDIQRVKDAASLDLVGRPSLRVMYLHIDGVRSPTPAVNLPTNPMRDLRVRQAISLAIDRKTLVRVTMNNSAYPTGQMVLKGMRGYLEDMGVPEFNIAKAKELLHAAGYGKGFAVSLDAPTGRYPNDAQVAQAIVGQLAKIGIVVDLRLHPKSVFFDFIRPGDKSSLILTGWAEDVDAGAMANILFYTRDKTKGKGNSNRGHYANAEFDRLIDEADATADLAKRNALLQRAMRILYVEDIGTIPLYFQEDIYGKKKTVQFTPRWDKNILAFELDIRN